jgi:hypothetical protein
VEFLIPATDPNCSKHIREVPYLSHMLLNRNTNTLKAMWNFKLFWPRGNNHSEAYFKFSDRYDKSLEQPRAFSFSPFSNNQRV